MIKDAYDGWVTDGEDGEIIRPGGLAKLFKMVRGIHQADGIEEKYVLYAEEVLGIIRGQAGAVPEDSIIRTSTIKTIGMQEEVLVNHHRRLAAECKRLEIPVPEEEVYSLLLSLRRAKTWLNMPPLNALPPDQVGIVLLMVTEQHIYCSPTPVAGSPQ